MTLSINRMANLAEVQRNTIYRWRKRPDWPGDSLTEAALLDYAAARKADLVAKQAGPHADAKKEKLLLQCSLLREQARRARADAEAAEIRVRKERGELAEVGVVASRFIALLNDFAARLKTWEESSIAKRPALRKDITRLAQTLRATFAEAGEQPPP
jgi:phage terminase Nu1 subunit (DNA packaging protein)